jgi:hypothetical protein
MKTNTLESPQNPGTPAWTMITALVLFSVLAATAMAEKIEAGVDARVIPSGRAAYIPGQTLTMKCKFTPGPDRLLGLLWKPQLPVDWTIVSVSGDCNPEMVRGEILCLAYDLPSTPIKLVLTVQVPATETKVCTLGITASYMAVGMANEVTINSEPIQLARLIKTNQTVAFPAIPDQTPMGRVILTAAADSGLAVSFRVKNGPGMISDNNVLTFSGAGAVHVVASQAGDDLWNAAADVTQKITVKAKTPPAAPSGVSASDGVYLDKISVTWEASSGATSYEVWRSAINDIAGASNLTTIASTTYDDLSAAAASETTLYYWVRAVSAAGAGGFSAGDSGCAQAALGPAIKANGARGEITVKYPENVEITVEMKVEDDTVAPADWWLLLCDGSSWYCLNSSMEWIQFDANMSNCDPVYQGDLVNISAMPVLTGSLVPGTYDLYFAVDAPMDGILDLEQMQLDSVKVNVQ